MAVERAPGRQPRHWLALALPGVIAAALLWQGRVSLQRDAGSALFHGETALSGRLAGHVQPLPTLATRCGNCHEAGSNVPAVRPGGGLGSYAGELAGERLVSRRQRRGGPPSAYDAAALCTLLRTGVDPAGVMIATAMPRYEASDAHCERLWSYLTRR